MKKNLSKKLGKFFGGMVMAAFVAAISMPVYAMEDGAYLVGRTTSYANPETGQTVDGGTNIALGDSMCASIVEESVLVEQYQGNTYVTLGIGLMSNISSVKFQIQGSDGSYREVSATQTGSCTRDGDTCNHYRIQVDSADNYISPILFVTPMGREVQFFVKLDMGSATAGTGNFVSEMIPAESTETASSLQQSAASTGSLASATTSTVEATNSTTTEGTAAATSAAASSVDDSQNTVDEKDKEKVEATESLEEATESLIEEETEQVEEATEVLELENTENLMDETEETENHAKKKSNTTTIAVIVVTILILVAACGVGYLFYKKKRK